MGDTCSAQSWAAGGMADVYQAHDQTLGREVAVKLLRERAPDPTERARFVAEAQTLARLNHPNLVAILDAGVSDEHPFLALELVAGSSLSVALTETGQGLPLERVASIGAQIAAALAHCHAAGVVHRDVKPGNILLGPADRALLTDFGISRLLADSAHHTKTGFTIGTASYLPRAGPRRRTDSRGHMYALGLVLIEACTGRREYTGTPVEAAVARLHRPPQVPVGLPPSLCAVLEALTQTDPVQRPDALGAARALATGYRAALGPGVESAANLGAHDAERWGGQAAPIAAPPAPTCPLTVLSAPHGPVTSAGTAAPVDPTDKTSPQDPSVSPGDRRRRRPPVFAFIGGALATVAAVALTAVVHGTSATPSTPTPGSTSQPEKPAAASASPTAPLTPAAKISPAMDKPRPTSVASQSSPLRSAKALQHSEPNTDKVRKVHATSQEHAHHRGKGK